MKINTKQMKRHAGVSAVSVAIDLIVFILLLRLMKKHSVVNGLFFSIFGARILSSFFNCLMHKNYTYKCKGLRCITHYYLLSIITVSVSLFGSTFFEQFTSFGILEGKLLTDALLGLLNFYLLPCHVFKKQRKLIRGAYGQFAERVAQIFFGNYSAGNTETDEATVFICRHGNMHGPMTTLTNMQTDLHPMVLSPFFSYKTCYHHFADFTFTARFGMPKIIAAPLAALCALLITPLMKSAQAVPVYRNESAMKTLRASLKYLMRDEPVIVFPDKEYTREDGDSDIYYGFLALGRLYLKKTGKPLRFVPLVIDDENRRICALPAFIWDSNDISREAAADYLRTAIHSDPCDSLPTLQNQLQTTQ